MLVVETIAKVRRAYFAQNKPIKMICRELGCREGSCARSIRSPATEFRYERSRQPLPRIDPWRDQLEGLLLANAGKPAREQLTLIRIFEELRAVGYEGSYDAVRRYAKRWRAERGAATAEAFVPPMRDALFADNPFFDPKDLVQVRYEMVRRHKTDGIPISDVAAIFGVSRPTFYKAQDTLAAAGLVGLLPQPRGPRGGHKISAEVVAFVVDLKAATPELTTPQCLAAVDARFGITASRSIAAAWNAHWHAKKNAPARRDRGFCRCCRQLRAAAGRCAPRRPGCRSPSRRLAPRRADNLVAELDRGARH